MTATLSTVARRGAMVAAAVVLLFGSLLGVLASWPVNCEIACKRDDLHGSLFWALVFAIPLAASVAGAALALFGKLRLAALALGFATVALAVAIVV